MKKRILFLVFGAAIMVTGLISCVDEDMYEAPTVQHELSTDTENLNDHGDQGDDTPDED